MILKALSVKQPWASLIASGRKWIELRTWTVSYRGPLLICASLGFAKEGAHWGVDGPRGRALCIVELVDVRPALASDEAGACCAISRPEVTFAWVLDDERPIQPFPVKGRLGLFEVDVPELAA
jgi:hypothetical protein